eukprot:1139347-Pelagomonas_calceolata.AAC.1
MVSCRGDSGGDGTAAPREYQKQHTAKAAGHGRQWSVRPGEEAWQHNRSTVENESSTNKGAGGQVQ